MSDLAVSKSQSPSASGLFRASLAFSATSILLLTSIALVLIGVHKALNLEDFRSVIASHGVLNADGAWLAAPPVSALEILIGVSSLWLVTVPARPTRAGLILAAIFLIFACYTALLAINPPPAPSSCGCLGSTALVDPHQWTYVASRNVGLALGVIIAGRLASMSTRRSTPLA